jgi:glycosyltransferase involved in cell wall biosynthesis
MNAVVIPVRGGDRRIAANLSALHTAARRAGLTTYVVDNGANDVVIGPLRDCAAPPVLVSCAEPGSYRARNAGVAAALGDGHETVLFTDADCRPLPGWPDHLLAVAAEHDVVVSVAAPHGRGVLARAAERDYRRRLAQWAGGPLVCRQPAGTLDTRAGAVRRQVLEALRFDERVRYAGDAKYGRQAIAAGFSVVGCHHEYLRHDPPTSWLGEYRKYRRIAAQLSLDLRELPRREVLRFLPEHAHLRLPATRRDLTAAARALALATVSADGECLYRAWRELAWNHGRWQARPGQPHRERSR